MAGLFIIVAIGAVVLLAALLAWDSAYGGAKPHRYTNTRPGGESDRSVGLLGAGLLPWQMDQPGEGLDRWARANDVEILRSEYRFMREGPFFWRSTRNQVVQHVTVRDRYGRERQAYVRTGHWLFGLLDDTLVAEWEPEAPREPWRR